MKTLAKRTSWTAALAALVLLPAGLASAPIIQEEDEDEEAEESAEEEEEPKWFAVVGGDVHTGTGAVLRGATILAKDGVIEEIGYDLYMPEDAEKLVVTGYRVYPGLVAMESNGLLGGGSDLENSVDPYNSRMVLALGAGVTATVQRNQAAKLKRGHIDGVVMRDEVFETASFSTRNPGDKRDWRERFERAAEHLREYRQWQIDVKDDKDLDEPSERGVHSTALAVLKGEKLLKFSADERTDLLEIARFAQEFGFRPVIDGCREGWTVADELGRAGAYAIVTPRYRRAKDERLVREGGSSIENAAILHSAGVQVVIQPQSTGISLGGIVGRDVMHLPIEAAFAVRGGLPEDAALAAITIVPARLMGVGHRIGTLEVGKDCDLIVTDGDVLHYQTFTQWAVVDGEVVYDKEQELYFAHIRPRPDSVLAPETRVDVGETAEPEEPADEGESEGDEDDDGGSR